jgi:helix-turn-helix protein
MVEHLNQNGLAKRWLISPRTLEQWRWQGRGPRYLKIGGRVVYRVSDIEAFEMSSIHANTLGAIDKGPEEKPGHGVC